MKVHPFLRRHRRPLITVVVLAAVFAIVLMVLPVAIRYAMVSWLRDDGRRKAEISDVDFNPFVARLVVHDLMIKGPDGNANVALASVELDPLALVRQRLHFATLRVEDAELTLTRLERGVRAADVPLGTGQQKQESGGGWSWGIDRLQLDDVVLHYRPAPASPPSRLTVSRLRLLELYSWRPEAEAPLQLQAALEDGELQVDGRMAPLAKAPSAELEVAVDKLDLARLWATGGPELAGHGPAPAGTADLNGHLLLNGGETLSATYQGSLALHRGAFGAGRLDSLEWTGQIGATSSQGKPLGADLGGTLKLAGVGFQDGQRRYGGGAASWSGKASLTRKADGSTALTMQGKVHADGLTAVDGARRLSRGVIDWNGTIAGSQAADGALQLHNGGDLALDDLSIETPDATLSHKRLAWHGKLSLQQDSGGALTVSGDGEAGSQGLDLAMKGAGLDVKQGEAQWSGRFSLSPGTAGQLAALTMQASAEVGGIAVSSPKRQLQLLSLDRLRFNDIAADSPATATVGSVEAEKLNALAPHAADLSGTAGNAPVALAGFDIAGVRLSHGNRLTMQQVTLKGGRVTVVRDNAGKLVVVDSAIALANELAGGKGKSKPATGEPFTFAVKRWTMTEDSELRFHDTSVEPAVDLRMSGLQLEIRDVDNAQPKDKSPVKLGGTIGKFTKVDLAGTMEPFADRLTMDVKGKVSGLELPELTGYARNALGYDLVQGRLDADLHAKAVAGELQSQSKLAISQLKVERSTATDGERLQKRVEIPMQTALSLLRDDKGNIQLSVPVRGNLSNPQFDFSDAINQAIAGALRETVLTTVKLAFPLGGVITTLAEFSGQKRVVLDPVIFAPGDSATEPKDNDYLGKVADFLRKRPEIRLSLCGRYTNADREVVRKNLLERQAKTSGTAVTSGSASAKGEKARKGQNKEAEPAVDPQMLRDRLNKLANIRAEAVKSRLVGGEGLAEQRLFICAPGADTKADAKPRVDLVL